MWPAIRLVKNMLFNFSFPYSSFLHEENFTQATEFIPQRWIPLESPEDWVHKAHLVDPFGSGKRICPGKRLSEQETHVITTLFLKLCNNDMTFLLN